METEYEIRLMTRPAGDWVWHVRRRLPKPDGSILTNHWEQIDSGTGTLMQSTHAIGLAIAQDKAEGSMK